MHNGKTLAIALAAMVVSIHINGAVGAAVPSTEQIATIENYVIARDYDALAGYLGAFPGLMEETTGFAQELRNFVQAYSENAAFAFSPTTLAAMQAALSSVPTAVAQQTPTAGAAVSLY